MNQLASDAAWLVGHAWKLEDGLCLDAVIQAHAHEYEVRVSFPDLYPDTPCVVRPRNADRRWTFHQYGDTGGPLCLEWGPDNWHSEITTAMMLESVHRLLVKENPHEGAQLSAPSVVPSRHLLTTGQELRSQITRWYSGPALRDHIAHLSKSSSGSFRYSLRKLGSDFVTFIHEVTSPDGEVWTDVTIPSQIPGATSLLSGKWLRTQLKASAVKGVQSIEQLEAILSQSEPDKALTLADGQGERASSLLIIDDDNEPHLLSVYPGGIAQDAVVRSESYDFSLRAPERSILKERKIGIVGLGSAGSKIAVSLARMGVCNFYLVDHDVFLPENLQRNQLDWQSVGRHKVNGVETAVGLVNVEARVETSRIHLTGQESSAAVAGVLQRLAKCDLIVDATADARVFNLLASIAKSDKRPMVWLEVFGGGLGGLVARSRPDLDPTPQDMRRAYLAYCEENPTSDVYATARRYDIENDDGAVLTASDADVSILASHAVRFVADCFLSPERSAFPYSMYLIGLQKGWIFDQPFCTIPISMESGSSTAWGTEASELTEEDHQFLLGLIEKKTDDHEATPAAPHSETTG